MEEDQRESSSNESLEPDNCIAANWLNLMYIIQWVSADQFNKIKDKVKSRWTMAPTLAVMMMKPLPLEETTATRNPPHAGGTLKLDLNF